MIQFLDVLRTEMPDYTFVFDERPGAGGIVAANSFVNERGDGTRLLLFGANGTLVYQDLLQANIVKYTRADLKTISAVYENKELLVTRSGSRIKNMDDFRSQVLSKKTQINIGVRTTTDKMMCLNLRDIAGKHVECVDYPNSYRLLQEIIGGQIEYGLLNYGDVVDQPRTQAIGSLRKYGSDLKSLSESFPALKPVYAGLAAMALPRSASKETEDWWELSLMKVLSSTTYKAFAERNHLHMEPRILGSKNFERLIIEARKNR